MLKINIFVNNFIFKIRNCWWYCWWYCNIWGTYGGHMGDICVTYGGDMGTYVTYGDEDFK